MMIGAYFNIHHSLLDIHHSHELTQPIFLMFLLIGDLAPFLRGICVGGSSIVSGE